MVQTSMRYLQRVWVVVSELAAFENLGQVSHESNKTYLLRK